MAGEEELGLKFGWDLEVDGLRLPSFEAFLLTNLSVITVTDTHNFTWLAEIETVESP